MSTLSLADLGPKMRHALGLENSCKHAGFRSECVATVVVTIPVIETAGPATPKPGPTDTPGAAWLRTGLHRLRVPPVAARGYDRPTGPEIS